MIFEKFFKKRINKTEAQFKLSYSVQNDTVIVRKDSPDSKGLDLIKDYGSLEGEQLLIEFLVFCTIPDSILRMCDLPPKDSFGIRIENLGILQSHNFELQFELIDKTGGFKKFSRNTCFLDVSGVCYTLEPHLLQLLMLLEDWKSNEKEGNNLEHWARVKSILNEDLDISVSDHLNSLEVHIPSHVSISLDNQQNIKPVLYHKDSIESEEYSSSLTKKDLEQLQDSFIQNSGDWGRVYSLPGNRFVIFNETLQKALSEIREIQNSDLDEKLNFVSNPAKYLNNSEEELEVFFESEEFLNDRVKYLGIWEPEIEKYVGPSQVGWFDGVEPEHDNLVTVHTDAESETEEDEESESRKYVPIATTNITDLEYEKLSVLSRSCQKGLPKHLNTKPYDYQLEGIKWLQNHYISGSKGCLLADDMGLGKTLQTLAFLAWVNEQSSNDSPILVVTPTSLTQNWIQESKQHLGEAGLGKHLVAKSSNIQSELRKLLPNDQDSTLEKVPKEFVAKMFKQFDVVYVTYETMRDKIFYFITTQWKCVVFDECQKLKTPTSRMRDMSLTLPTDFKLLLTGTPVENTLIDFWCLVDNFIPGLLGSYQEFVSKYVDGNDDINEIRQKIENPIKTPETTIPPILMRRLKLDKLPGLPTKQEIPLISLMPSIQEIEYDKALDVYRQSATDSNSNAILVALQKMKKVSLYPSDPSNKTDDEFLNHSARISKLVEKLNEIKKTGDSILIFIERKDVQSRLQKFLFDYYSLSLPPSIINGDTPAKVRQRITNNFQSNDYFEILILSPKAAGTGLTLTKANHVIHLDRWWNPAVEAQASDRVFRIGQKKSVYVYPIIAEHRDYGASSFDWKLHELMEKKKKLAENLLSKNTGSSNLEYFKGM